MDKYKSLHSRQLEKDANLLAPVALLTVSICSSASFVFFVSPLDGGGGTFSDPFCCFSSIPLLAALISMPFMVWRTLVRVRGPPAPVDVVVAGAVVVVPRLLGATEGLGTY